MGNATDEKTQKPFIGRQTTFTNHSLQIMSGAPMDLSPEEI